MGHLALLELTRPSFPAFLLGLGALAVTLFLVLNGFYLWSSRNHPGWKLEPALLFSVFWGLAAGVSILGSIFYAFEGELQQVHAFFCALGGASAGWVVGMYLTPQDATERGQFAKIGAAVTAVLSGYGIKTVQDVALRPGFRVYAWSLALALLSAVFTAAAIYNTRAYGRIYVRISFDHEDPDARTQAKLKRGETLLLSAAVSGPDDTSVLWSVSPSAFGAVEGREFKPLQAGRCRIKAESVLDPSLCALLEVTVD